MWPHLRKTIIYNITSLFRWHFASEQELKGLFSDIVTEAVCIISSDSWYLLISSLKAGQLLDPDCVPEAALSCSSTLHVFHSRAFAAAEPAQGVFQGWTQTGCTGLQWQPRVHVCTVLQLHNTDELREWVQIWKMQQHCKTVCDLRSFWCKAKIFEWWTDYCNHYYNYTKYPS